MLGGLRSDFIYSIIVLGELILTNRSGLSASLHSDIITTITMTEPESPTGICMERSEFSRQTHNLDGPMSGEKESLSK